jgi:deoxyhypusine synthase
MNKQYLRDKVKTIEVKERKISELIREMQDVSFQGRSLGEAYNVLKKMLLDKDTTIIMGISGSLSTAGMWKIIKWLIDENYIDVLVSTGANISEDIYEAMGASYYKGSPYIDDSELFKYKIDRFYDTFADEDEYSSMENLIYNFAKNIDSSKVYSSREFLWKFGEFLNSKKIFSIVTSAYLRRMPIYSPALADSAYGIALSKLKIYDNKLVAIDATLDLVEISKIIANSKKTGVIYIGGGVPKDFIQIATISAPFYGLENDRKPHSYAIQITTDSPQWGGLSGCTLEEAVSWGKISSQASKITVYCDATIALPILAHSILESKIKRKAKDFNEIL